MRENRTQGFARGAPGNRCPYLNLLKNIMADTEDDPALTALITSARSGCADAVEHGVRDVYVVGLKSSHVQPLIDLLQLD